MKQTTLVSAIVLNYRTPAETVRCVDALKKQTVASDLEIIVVDNFSQDTSMDELRRAFEGDEKVHLMQTGENLGYGRGNNVGIEHASGDFILVVNPDTKLHSDALEKMIRFAEANPDVGIIGPQLIFPDGTIRDSYRTFPTFLDVFIKRSLLRFFFRKRMAKYLQWHQDPHATRDADWVVGACLLIRRDFFHDIGGFDPRYFLFFDDTDLCRRCHEANKRVVYLPEAKADDSAHRLSSGGLLSFFFRKTVRIHVASACKYFWKWRNK